MDMAPDPALKTGPGVALRAADAAGRKALWDDLARDVAEPNSFYTSALLSPALEHIADGIDIRLIEAWEKGVLIGLMPVTRASHHGRLPIATTVNWTHPHCFFGAPLIRRGREAAAWRLFLDQLDADPWAPGLLHLSGLDAAGANVAALEAVCAQDGRPWRELNRYDRALLRTDMDADAYWEATVRSKKRKEIRRLQKRLADMGDVQSRLLCDATELPVWIDSFLALEAAGWKGDERTAMACKAADEAFLRVATQQALADDALHFLRLDLDGRAIAMLINFRHGAGAFSFKIAIDETLGRFSPGVLIELENLRTVCANPAIEWMDSCAAADHPMIDSLWGERRSIAQYRVALRGSGLPRLRRNAAYAIATAADRLTAILKGSR